MMVLALFATALLLTQGGGGQEPGFPGTATGKAPKVEIPWNRLYDYPEIYAHLDRLMETWPEFVSMTVIGHSTENREMRVYTLNNPATGAPEDKPAMWIDGNVHGNEVQGGEVVVYTAWYLLENYGSNPRVTELLDRAAFYLLPMVNPDGRAHWFNEAHSASSSRTGYRPIDNDRDGVADEDPPNDLDGDGHIVSMRKYVPGEGTHRLDPDDPRVMVRVPANDKGIRGDWILLGSEGIDDDGDGRINEDGLGGYDMNRAWPSFWQPGHVQYGAGPYPLYWPETRSIARFLYEHPNVAAVQSFHNAGGMILRGPGTEGFGSYPAADVRVFDELGEDGEKMLPFYRYMIIWKDLYTVFGGFATWTYEGLGIISFTNELWVNRRLYPDGRGSRSNADRHFFDDALLMSAGFIDWHPYEHPLYGSIEIGGFRKDVGRVPPTFLIEEMLHRNALFCLKHAEAMPQVVIEKVEVTPIEGAVRAIDVIFRNERPIPTRTARAAGSKIGAPDVFTITGQGLEVLAGGFRSDRFRPERIELAEREPERLLRETGIGGRREVRVRWFVRGTGTATVGWEGEKGANVSEVVEVR
ncbi:MAG: peptidase M14 [Planctomycetota bacterium]|nr:MAG: peptidase M14 [Planctomycetota bacterium]